MFYVRVCKLIIYESVSVFNFGTKKPSYSDASYHKIQTMVCKSAHYFAVRGNLTAYASLLLST